MAKQCVNNFIEPLTYLINTYLSSGIFPIDLRIAKVVPIFKSGDTSSFSNYRPISILSFFSKIIVKIMYNHIVNFMDAHEVLNKYQFGFRSNHSTQQAINTLVNRITKCQDSECNDIVIGIFLDLKKAFDTVDHSILI